MARGELTIFLALTLARHFFAKQYQDQNKIEDQAYPHQGGARSCFRIAREFRMV